jgi:eukaryotic-like serine/threonine-protein kinase
MKIFKRSKYWFSLTALMLTLPLLVIVSGCMGIPPTGGSGALISGDKLFVVSVDGNLHLRNADTGVRIWSVELQREVSEGVSCDLLSSCAEGGAQQGVAVYGTPTLSGDYIYVGGYDGRLRVYNWQERIEAPVAEYPAEKGKFTGAIVGDILLDGGNIYFGSADGSIYCLNANPEQLVHKWSYPTGDKVWAAPVIADGVLYATSFDHKIYALDTADGSLVWARPYETDGAISAAPLIDNGTLYVGGFDRYMYALDTASGELKWRTSEPAQNWFWSTPLKSGNTIIAGSLDGNVYFFDAATGAPAATPVDLGSPLTSAPVMDGDHAIFAAQTGKVCAIDTLTFLMNWCYSEPVSDDTNLYAPVSVHNGILYIHTQDPDTIYTYEIATGMSYRAPLPLSAE